MNNLINTLRVKQVRNNLERNSSNPKKVVLDDNGKDVNAVAKLFNGTKSKENKDNSKCNLILFNELVCYQLARIINIPMPESGICFVDETTEIDPDVDIDSDNFGPGFYSKYINDESKNTYQVQNISNLNEIIKIMLFDHIIFNWDRNEFNILIQYTNDGYKLVAIDHTHVFGEGPVWDSDRLNGRMNEKDYNSNTIMSKRNNVYKIYYEHIQFSRTKFEKEADLIKRYITKNKIADAILYCPDEWKPPKKDSDALIEYLMYRIEHIEDIISVIMNYINNPSS